MLVRNQVENPINTKGSPEKAGPLFVAVKASTDVNDRRNSQDNVNIPQSGVVSTNECFGPVQIIEENSGRCAQENNLWSSTQHCKDKINNKINKNDNFNSYLINDMISEFSSINNFHLLIDEEEERSECIAKVYNPMLTEFTKSLIGNYFISVETHPLRIYVSDGDVIPLEVVDIKPSRVNQFKEIKNNKNNGNNRRRVVSKVKGEGTTVRVCQPRDLKKFDSERFVSTPLLSLSDGISNQDRYNFAHPLEYPKILRLIKRENEGILSPFSSNLLKKIYKMSNIEENIEKLYKKSTKMYNTLYLGNSCSSHGDYCYTCGILGDHKCCKFARYILHGSRFSMSDISIWCDTGRMRYNDVAIKVDHYVCNLFHFLSNPDNNNKNLVDSVKSLRKSLLTFNNHIDKYTTWLILNSHNKYKLPLVINPKPMKNIPVRQMNVIDGDIMSCFRELSVHVIDPKLFEVTGICRKVLANCLCNLYDCSGVTDVVGQFMVYYSQIIESADKVISYEHEVTDDSGYEHDSREIETLNMYKNNNKFECDINKSVRKNLRRNGVFEFSLELDREPDFDGRKDNVINYDYRFDVESREFFPNLGSQGIYSNWCEQMSLDELNEVVHNIRKQRNQSEDLRSYVEFCLMSDWLDAQDVVPESKENVNAIISNKYIYDLVSHVRERYLKLRAIARDNFIDELDDITNPYILFIKLSKNDKQLCKGYQLWKYLNPVYSGYFHYYYAIMFIDNSVIDKYRPKHTWNDGSTKTDNVEKDPLLETQTKGDILDGGVDHCNTLNGQNGSSRGKCYVMSSKGGQHAMNRKLANQNAHRGRLNEPNVEKKEERIARHANNKNVDAKNVDNVPSSEENVSRVQYQSNNLAENVDIERILALSDRQVFDYGRITGNIHCGRDVSFRTGVALNEAALSTGYSAEGRNLGKRDGEYETFRKALQLNGVINSERALLAASRIQGKGEGSKFIGTDDILENDIINNRDRKENANQIAGELEAINEYNKKLKDMTLQDEHIATERLHSLNVGALKAVSENTSINEKERNVIDNEDIFVESSRVKGVIDSEKSNIMRRSELTFNIDNRDDIIDNYGIDGEKEARKKVTWEQVLENDLIGNFDRKRDSHTLKGRIAGTKKAHELIDYTQNLVRNDHVLTNAEVNKVRREAAAKRTGLREETMMLAEKRDNLLVKMELKKVEYLMDFAIKADHMNEAFDEIQEYNYKSSKAQDPRHLNEYYVDQQEIIRRELDFKRATFQERKKIAEDEYEIELIRTNGLDKKKKDKLLIYEPVYVLNDEFVEDDVMYNRYEILCQEFHDVHNNNENDVRFQLRKRGRLDEIKRELGAMCRFRANAVNVSVYLNHSDRLRYGTSMVEIPYFFTDADKSRIQRIIRGILRFTCYGDRNANTVEETMLMAPDNVAWQVPHIMGNVTISKTKRLRNDFTVLGLEFEYLQRLLQDSIFIKQFNKYCNLNCQSVVYTSAVSMSIGRVVSRELYNSIVLKIKDDWVNIYPIDVIMNSILCGVQHTKYWYDLSTKGMPSNYVPT